MSAVTSEPLVPRNTRMAQRSRKSFWINVFTVLTGTALAQAIPIAVLPLVARLVNPEALGQYLLWFGASNVLIVVSTARLDMAIFTAVSKQAVEDLLGLIICCSLLVAAVTVLIVRLVIPGFGLSMPDNAAFEFSFSLAMFSLSAALNQGLLAVLIYQAKFRKLGMARILVASTVALLQLVTAYAGWGVAGLVYAQLLMTSICVLATAKWSGMSLVHLLKRVSGPRLLETLKKNYRFPVFSMPGDLVNNVAAQLPLFVILARFGEESLAHFALTTRTLAGPVGLIAGSVVAVFKEQASRDFREQGNCVSAYRHTFKSLILLGIVPLVSLGLFGEHVFVLAFGGNWRSAGQYAQILAPMFYLKFIASPLSFTFYIAQRQTYDLYWQLCLLAVTSSAFTLTGDIRTAVIAYAAGYTGLYVVYLFLSYAAARGAQH